MNLIISYEYFFLGSVAAITVNHALRFNSFDLITVIVIHD